MLKEYDRVLYLDCDILIQGDISPIFREVPLAWRPTVDPLHNKINPLTFSEWKGVTEKNSAPNGGVIFASRLLPNYCTATERCYSILEKLAPLTNAGCLDELVFGLFAYQYQVDVYHLPKRFNCVADWEHSEDAYIVHSVGKDKFWNNILRTRLFPAWEHNNNYWKSLGGSSYVGSIALTDIFGNSNRGIIKGVNNILFWEEYFANKTPFDGLIRQKFLTKSYVQFYLPNLEKTIHYELLVKGKQMIVALHFEGKSAEENTLIRQIDECLDRTNFSRCTMKNGVSFQQTSSFEKSYSHLFSLITKTKAVLVK